ncbi:MAG TPA: hypothetical protein VGT40_10915 [Methylomirabilota bacterium]|jgi:hypothetical protein|nr:hypothetical protein [Methylomirabilota bacterium]
MSTAGQIRLVDPTGGAPEPRAFALAPRPRDLKGKRLGLLDNSKSGSEQILRAIARVLDAEFAWADVFHVTKHSASLPPRPEVLEALHRHADVVIAGVGD